MRLKKTKIFIFARANSQGVKNKNIVKIKGKPLIFYSIKIALQITNKKNIFISTDSKQIKKIAIENSINIIDRPRKLASGKSPEILSWKHAINFVQKNFEEFDVFVSLPATSPLRNKFDVLRSIKKLKNKTDVVLTATEANRNPSFNMVKKIKNGYYDVIMSGKRIFNRQDAPKVFDLNTVAFVTKPNFILNCNSIFDGNVDINLVDKKRSIDIDSYYDLKIAKMLI